MTVPVECFDVRVTVHQQPGARFYGYSIEVADPHTKELLALISEPCTPTVTQAQLCGRVTTDLRAVLLDLTDPDPF